MSSDPEAIIFDFGGVLINICYEDTICAFKSLGMENFDKLYCQAEQSKLFDLFETGEISAQRFINEVLNYLPAGTSPNAVVAAWNAMIKDVPQESIDLLENLKSKHKRIYLLSNTNEIHLPLALRAWGKVSDKTPYDLFDKVYLSYEMRLRKPNPEIFESVIREQGLSPASTLFIDDSIQHVEGANKLGLNTLHLHSRSQLQTFFS